MKNLFNVEELMDMVNDVNSYDGSLEYLVAYEHDEDFYRDYYGNDPDGLARAIYYGGKYNYMDEYIRWNGYGNLETLNSYEYEKEILSDYEWIIENYKRLIDDGSIDDDYNYMHRINLLDEEEEEEEGEK